MEQRMTWTENVIMERKKIRKGRKKWKERKKDGKGDEIN